MSNLHLVFAGIFKAHFGIEPMTDGWQKCDGTMPCGHSDYVDVRYDDSEESLMLIAGGLPWSTIVEWRLSQPYGAIKAAYTEAWKIFNGPDSKPSEWNWANSQAYDDAIEAQRIFGKMK